MRKVLVTGDRNWDDEAYMEQVMVNFGFPTRVAFLIHGNARGADKMSEKVAVRLGLPEERILRFQADWSLGRAAGPIRNRTMFLKTFPTDVLAFHKDISKSKGTKDMVAFARTFKACNVWCSWEQKNWGVACQNS